LNITNNVKRKKMNKTDEFMGLPENWNIYAHSRNEQ
jgi:hypothetical protein